MRFLLLLPLLFTPLLAQAEPANPGTVLRAFELAGIRLLCEQSAPLIQRGLAPAQQEQVAREFAAEPLCAELAERVAKQLDAAQVRQVEALLASPLAQRFTAAEQVVGEPAGGEGLASYREQLKAKPPRQERLALVDRLDQAAHTTELATLLRYETGKTQALLTLRARGESLSEAALSQQTAQQAETLRASSRQAVQSFMLYAYRQMPSNELSDYAGLYEQDPVRLLLKASVEALPALFAGRRAALR
ncbi:hypothetical protein D3880_21870 [Pseudomonas cavernae]|uniref:DUF2059 domain-containing protein n=1 Tax=Pseudomonas cavernae TaxID=2320867 RepID=A0A385Z6C2_9PSED|nr:hypothetical protein [Pseudomonas cavernae]AYC34859.1 hypothetical protein D3880_21870 [Pseudomonas cavernae]